MSLTFVFDPAQSIYSWRGSRPFLALNYKNLFPGRVKEYTILKNYRTPKQLVDLANQFRELFAQHDLPITPSEAHLPESSDVFAYRAFDTSEGEIDNILREIKYLHDTEGVPYSKMSILCRRNEDLGMFESGVVALGIPYYFKFDNLSIMRQSGFRFLYSLYSLMLDPTNTLAFREVLSPIKGIGKQFLENMKHLLPSKTHIMEFFSPANREKIPNIKSKQWQSVLRFVDSFLKPVLSLRESGLSYPAMNRSILSTLNNTVLLEEDYRKADKQKEGVSLNLQRVQLLAVFNTLASLYKISCEDPSFKEKTFWNQFVDVYENLQLSQDVHNEVREKTQNLSPEERKKEERDSLGFFTIHSFKGKENEYIYYAMVNGQRALDFNDFESKCVFYVAITRAKKKLTISGSLHVRSYSGHYVLSYENPFVNHLREIIKRTDLKKE